MGSPSGTRTVRLDPTDAEFKQLVAEIRSLPGIYWFQHGELVLKVGQSGKRRGKGSGVGNRLHHHVSVAYKDLPSHRRDFPAWHAFMRALVNRRITVRWMQCPPDQLDATEQRAIQDASGGVLWESCEKSGIGCRKIPESTKSSRSWSPHGSSAIDPRDSAPRLTARPCSSGSSAPRPAPTAAAPFA